MTLATLETHVGRLGLLLGAAAVCAWLLIAGQPAGAPAPAASLRVGALASGALELAPLGAPVLQTTKLEPGGAAARGTLRVRNQTPRGADVAVRTGGARRELDRLAWIEVRAGERMLMRAPLGRARRWSDSRVRIPAGARRTLAVRVWLPAQARDGWQATSADVSLELDAKVVAAR